MKKYIVVSNPANWQFLGKEIPLVSAQDYLSDPSWANIGKARVFNLCKDYSYQSKGYYVSLLAEARGHIPVPTVKNIIDVKTLKLVKIVSEEFDDVIQSSLKGIKSEEFILSIYFGQNVANKYKELSSLFYRHFQLPFIRVKFTKGQKWQVSSVKSISDKEIPEDHLESVQDFAKQYFSKKRYDSAKIKSYDFDLAILHNPKDPAPPSNSKALKKFIEIADSLNIYAELVEPKDLSRLSSFDALFIRQSTEVNNEAYAFARKAQQEDIALVDYPDAILKCCNKVYMAEALKHHNIDTPKTVIIHKDNKKTALAEIGLPCILKAPDSTFSFGVKKAKTEEDYEQLVGSMLKESDLIIAQEFCPSDYDWRIGILDGVAFYACKYYMASGHWQIYNWEAKKKKEQDGNHECLPLEEVPKKVMDAALKSAKIMGKGLYGIDVKQLDNRALVIEINDNPNIDVGVEDLYYGDEVYKNVLMAFKNRMA